MQLKPEIKHGRKIWRYQKMSNSDVRTPSYGVIANFGGQIQKTYGILNLIAF